MPDMFELEYNVELTFNEEEGPYVWATVIEDEETKQYFMEQHENSQLLKECNTPFVAIEVLGQWVSSLLWAEKLKKLSSQARYVSCIIKGETDDIIYAYQREMESR